MKTLTIDDKLYSYLQERSEETGRPINDLATDAIKLWLLGLKRSKAELSKKVAPRPRHPANRIPKCRRLANPTHSFELRSA